MYPRTTVSSIPGMPAQSRYTNLPHSLILIPHWIETALNRAQVDLSQLIYYDKLKSVIPLVELAAMASLTRMDVLRQLGLDYAEVGCDLTDLLQIWGNGYPYGSQENKDLYTTLVPLASSQEIINDTYERLFTEKRVDLDPELTFKIVEVKENHLGVVIYPGYFNGDPGRIFMFLDTLMQTQYQRHPLHVLAQRPVFRRYLSLLEKSSTAA